MQTMEYALLAVLCCAMLLLWHYDDTMMTLMKVWIDFHGHTNAGTNGSMDRGYWPCLGPDTHCRCCCGAKLGPKRRTPKVMTVRWHACCAHRVGGSCKDLHRRYVPLVTLCSSIV